MAHAARFRQVIIGAAMGAAGLIARAPEAGAQAQPGHVPGVHDHAATAFRIPESMQAEHAEIQTALASATMKSGQVGAAARELAALLHPHFVREEQIALPPLALLAPLSRGPATPEMRAVLPLTDSLRAELPRMLEEHKAIHAATMRLLAAARANHDSDVERLAEQLALHARSEEEMFYPAALLVGDVVRAQLGDAEHRRLPE